MNEQHYLALFRPHGIIGAGEGAGPRQRSTQHAGAGFKGKLFAVSPKCEACSGVPCYKSVEDIPAARLDLARDHHQGRPGAGDCRRTGGRAGLSRHHCCPPGFSVLARAARMSRRTPENARRPPYPPARPQLSGRAAPTSWASTPALPTAVRSGLHRPDLPVRRAVLCCLVERARTAWAFPLVSLGTSVDIDFGGRDPQITWCLTPAPRASSCALTGGIKDALSFVGPARRGCVKPVLLIKVGASGRLPGGPVLEAPWCRRRCGVRRRLRRAGDPPLQHELCSRRGAILRASAPRGNLAVITNGGGPRRDGSRPCLDLRIPMAKLTDATVAKLSEVLPVTGPTATRSTSSATRPRPLRGACRVLSRRGTWKAC